MSEFKRADGRANDEIRPIKAEIHVLKNADGSAYFEMGNTKVIAAVYGNKKLQARTLFVTGTYKKAKKLITFLKRKDELKL